MIWKTIKTFSNYEVSEFGEVRNASTKKIRKLSKNNKGYLQTSLYNGNSRKSVKIHRIVAQEFIDNPKGKNEVNHKDGDKTNNHISNLEWVTRSENIKHAWDNGLNNTQRKKVSEVLSNANSKAVVDLQTGIFYKSLISACKATNCKYAASAKQIEKSSKTQRFKYI